MAKDVGEYLEERGAQPFVWGVNDCMMMPADWLALLADEDPAESWRGLYDDQDGAARIVAGAGGMVALMRVGALSVGAYELAPGRAPPGSVGIVMAPTAQGPQQTGAVRTGLGWAVLEQTGILVGNFEALGAWAVI